MNVYKSVSYKYILQNQEHFRKKMEEELTELASKVKIKVQSVETETKGRNSQTESARNNI